MQIIWRSSILFDQKYVTKRTKNQISNKKFLSRFPVFYCLINFWNSWRFPNTFKKDPCFRKTNIFYNQKIVFSIYKNKFLWEFVSFVSNGYKIRNSRFLIWSWQRMSISKKLYLHFFLIQEILTKVYCRLTNPHVNKKIDEEHIRIA